MTVKDIASKIAKLEGKKVQARIGEIRELLSILSDLIVYDLKDNKTTSETVDTLVVNGFKRLNDGKSVVAEPKT